MRYFGGGDPGKKGALVIIDGSRKIVASTVMPVVKMGKGGKREFDPRWLCNWLADRRIEICQGDEWFFTIEKSQAYPKQGGVSNHSTGMGDMMLWALMECMQIPFQRIPPKHWQKVMFAGIVPGDPKKRALIKAQQLFPGETFFATPRCTTPHDGLVDAALMAVYGQMTYGATP